MSRFAPPLLLVAVLLCCGCSVAIKGGRHVFRDDKIERLRSKPTLAAWEVDAGIHEFLQGRVELTGGIAVVSPPRGTEFADLRLTTRYYFQHRQRVSPFLGGGLGWYRWSQRRIEDVPGCPECAGSREGTLAQGFYPHVAAGMNVRASRGIDFVVEGRWDASKRDGSADLEGHRPEFDSHQIAVGVRFQLRR